MEGKDVRVGIDARFITRHPRRGIGNYSLNVVAELVRLSPETEFFLYISAPDHEGILPRAANVTVRQLTTPAYPFWEQLALPRAARHDHLDILHCLGNTAPVIMPRGIKLVLSLMDVMFLQTGEFVPKPTNNYQALGRIYRRAVVPRCTLSADRVITISEYSRRDILDLIPNLDPERVSVTFLSCDAIFKQAVKEQPQNSVTGRSPYILTLGANDPRKNTLRLVKAYLALWKKHEIDEQLVISGYANWENSEAYRVVKNAGATDRVKFLSFISIEELADLYRNATFFVYPSLYEGFGIPLLEAFSAKCPVLASNTTSIPEVGGDAALYVDPLNQDSIEQAMYQLVHDDKLRQSLADRGYARALEFTWTETARKTLSIYQHCMSEK
ncbi:glycosyltransferase family 4 protein [Collimonas pratensis]|uniref:glycosyltransferase family 4 protein n=1 Tax=Collimonas pratensis TaxID=279113 RepID=UPI00078231B6|nr:glycosyltransferase family 1 protein [Collimonas pratensis]